MTNELSDLAQRITAAHFAARRSAAEHLEHVLAIAALVAEARAKIEWGQWEDWVRKRLPFGPRQASKYLRLHEHRHLIRSSGSELSIPARASIAEVLGSLVRPDPEPRPASTPRPREPEDDAALPVGPDPGTAEWLEKFMLPKVVARVEHWLGRAPFGAELTDPETLAAKCTNPESLRRRVGPAYEQLRLLLNALDARLRAGRDKPAAVPQPVPGDIAPPGGFLR